MTTGQPSGVILQAIRDSLVSRCAAGFQRRSSAMGPLALKLTHTATFLRKEGLRSFGRELGAQLVNDYYEHRFGVLTAKTVKLADLGIHQPEAQDSIPINYSAFYAAIKRLKVDFRNGAFLDIGAGKGRVLCAASALPFKRVVGVELSDALAQTAKDNLARMKRRRAKHVEVHVADASQFAIPPDVNLIYMYNPFFGQVLRSVVENIRTSLRMHPRRIDIVFFNNDHFDPIIESHPWLRKTFQTEFHPKISCGFYETLL